MGYIFFFGVGWGFWKIWDRSLWEEEEHPGFGAVGISC